MHLTDLNKWTSWIFILQLLSDPLHSTFHSARALRRQQYELHVLLMDSKADQHLNRQLQA